MSSAVCPQCGSLRTRAVRGNPLQQIVAVVRGQVVIACGRCGFTGRSSRLAQRSDAAAAARHRAGEDRLDYQALDRALAEGGDTGRPPGRQS